MIALAASQFSTLSPVILKRADGKSKVRDLSRRVSRTATLDGGAAITDRGFSHADRTFTVVEPRVSQSTADALEALMRRWPLLVVCTPSGAYLGAPSQLTYADGEIRLQILVSSCLSE